MDDLQPTDILMLAVSRRPGGLMLAGMTTERDETTGLCWVRPMPEGGVWSLDAARYADGTLIQPCDVVRLTVGPREDLAPYVENAPVELGDAPPERVRRLSEERRAAFFANHLDKAPAEVLRERVRSLCLVRPDWLHAIASLDEETGRFETRLALRTNGLKSNEEGVAVVDIYWRALMRQWLGEEPYVEFEDAEMRARFGEVYLVLGLGRKGPLIFGVHTVPEYSVTIDEDAL